MQNFRSSFLHMNHALLARSCYIVDERIVLQTENNLPPYVRLLFSYPSYVVNNVWSIGSKSYFTVKTYTKVQMKKYEEERFQILPFGYIRNRRLSVFNRLQKFIHLLSETPFILRYHFLIQTKHHILLGIEMCADLSLGHLLDNEKEIRLNTSDIKFFIIQVFIAIRFLHSNHIIHRSIEPNAIKLDVNGYVKLAGFDNATMLSQYIPKTYSITGRPGYIAPEQFSGNGYSYECDWFSMASLLHYLLRRKPLYESQIIFDAFETDDDNETSRLSGQVADGYWTGSLGRSRINIPSEVILYLFDDTYGLEDFRHESNSDMIKRLKSAIISSNTMINGVLKTYFENWIETASSLNHFNRITTIWHKQEVHDMQTYSFLLSLAAIDPEQRWCSNDDPCQEITNRHSYENHEPLKKQMKFPCCFPRHGERRPVSTASDSTIYSHDIRSVVENPLEIDDYKQYRTFEHHSYITSYRWHSLINRQLHSPVATYCSRQYAHPVFDPTEHSPLFSVLPDQTEINFRASQREIKEASLDDFPDIPNIEATETVLKRIETHRPVVARQSTRTYKL
ncbi:hypothetical protein SNEBB_004089 [Seison nebaliae]|nr:hypothetical protein SNEBB_004089 [Seison nebaliae]